MKINTELSGSTCSGIIIDENEGVVWYINLGDSRTINV